MKINHPTPCGFDPRQTKGERTMTTTKSNRIDLRNALRLTRVKRPSAELKAAREEASAAYDRKSEDPEYNNLETAKLLFAWRQYLETHTPDTGRGRPVGTGTGKRPRLSISLDADQKEWAETHYKSAGACVRSLIGVAMQGGIKEGNAPPDDGKVYLQIGRDIKPDQASIDYWARIE